MKAQLASGVITLVCLSLGFGVSADDTISDRGDQEIPVEILTFPGGYKEDNLWISIHAAGNGKVYIGLVSHGASAGFYEYDSRNNEIRHIAQMDRATRQYSPHAEPHSKIHCKIQEDKEGRIWFGSDTGYHFYGTKWDAPDGYPGAHMFVYHPELNLLENRGIPFPRASIRVLAIDKDRDVLYVVTFPDGRFYSYDIETGRTSFKGRVNNNDAIGRMLVLDDDGNVYGSFNPYRIFKYDPSADRMSDLPVIIPHKAGPWCDKGHYHREDVWRDVTWHPEERVIYGIEMGSSTLFRFDPKTNDIEDLGQLVLPELMGERIVPETSHSLMWHDGLQRLIYSAPHPNQHTDPKPRHLLSYDPQTGEKVDHGAMVDPETGAFPYYTEGVSIADDGTIYFCGNVKLPGVSAGLRKRTCGLVILKPDRIGR